MGQDDFQTIGDQMDEAKKKKEAEASSPTGPSSQSITTNAGESAGIGGGAPVQAPVAGASATGSGQYSNLQKYMKANQGANLAGKVASNIATTGEQFKTDLGKAQGAFSQQAQTAFGNVDNLDLVKRAAEDPLGFYNKGVINTTPEVMTPEEEQRRQKVTAKFNVGAPFGNSETLEGSFTPEQRQAKMTAAVEAARDASYTGPQSLNDLQGDFNYGQLAVGAQKIGEQTKAAQSEAGRYGLLQNMFGKQGYTKGQQNLDNLLLSNKDQLRILGQTRAIGATAGRELSEVQASAQKTARENTAGANTIQEQSRAALNEAVNKIGGKGGVIDTQLAMQQQRAADALLAAKESLKTGKISEADVDRLGLRGETLFLNNLPDMDQVFKATQEATRSNVVDDETRAKIAALQGLLGSGGASSVESSRLMDEIRGSQNTFDPNSYTADPKLIHEAALKSGEWQDGRLLEPDEIQKLIDRQANLDAQWDWHYAHGQEVRNDNGGTGAQSVLGMFMGANGLEQSLQDTSIEHSRLMRNAARAEKARLLAKLADYQKNAVKLGSTAFNKDINTGEEATWAANPSVPAVSGQPIAVKKNPVGYSR